ncbi:MAG: cyclic pyranopterin phosphate synthase MoaA [Omnitrophica bacterium RIFCSPLOWO2_01_FULL_45_24]|nr:MAG: cyclic pyranopterin phosphate synthase MoaA [Omnitrophica bacterium RIFCSPLOWO2_01_FULL_45_24]OGW92853.1 MAG: cyclic pyranopterin phosphate synthase MoaA [Omnitrophica bacterium RIFCSPLOWO2_12_FULL_45_13]
MHNLIDKFDRTIDYLRVSVTDRCNLRCVYCMPADGIVHNSQDNILSFEEIYRIVNAAVRLGVRKVRITGGEPLVRNDLPLLIEGLKTIHGLEEIALTTNGIYLRDYAAPLKRAGLDRVNISLDSLDPKKFRSITRRGDLYKVLEGIEASLSIGFSPVKINTILIKGINEDEILAFANLARTRHVHIRFIEYMPTGIEPLASADSFFSSFDAKAICQSLGELEPVNGHSSSAARVFRIRGFYGTIGFISPISEPFCYSCNKLRLTSDGHLRSCLHSSHSVDIKGAMRRGILEGRLETLIKEVVAMKPQSHSLSERPLGAIYENFSMCQIGG